MEFKEIYGFIFLLVLVGILLGVGVLTYDKFGEATRENTAVTNETVAISGAIGSLANDDIVSSSDFRNMSLIPLTGNWTVYTNGSVFVNTLILADGNYNISYVYPEDSPTTLALADMNTNAILPITSTWLPLLVTVFILAIILTLVIRSFAQRRD